MSGSGHVTVQAASIEAAAIDAAALKRRICSGKPGQDFTEDSSPLVRRGETLSLQETKRTGRCSETKEVLLSNGGDGDRDRRPLPVGHRGHRPIRSDIGLDRHFADPATPI